MRKKLESADDDIEILPTSLERSVSQERETDSKVEPSSIVEGGLRIGNTHELVNIAGTQNRHNWSVFVRAENGSSLEDVVDYVAFELHPSFHPAVIKLTKAPYSVSRLGWGTFEVGITIHWKSSVSLPPSHFTHMLRFSIPETSKVVSVYQDKDKDSETEDTES